MNDGYYSYIGCLDAAGAAVHADKMFGNWQGTGLALVTYRGTTGWVAYSFGSCPGCDALAACCAEVDARGDFTAKQAADFGRKYLDNIMSQEEAEAFARRDLDWDMDAAAMHDFVVTNDVRKINP